MAQIGRPDADVTAGAWTTAPLFDKIDETSRDDGDLITSADNSASDVCEVGLPNFTDPVTSSGYKVTYTYRKNAAAGHVVNVIVRLMEGATARATWTHSDVSETFTEVTQTLTGGEADSISDHTNLRLQFERTGDTGGPGGTRRSAQVSWAFASVPSAFSIVGAISVPPTIAAGLTFDAVLTGAVAVPVTVAAAMTYTPQAQIVGSVTVSSSIAAAISRRLVPEDSGSATGFGSPHGAIVGGGYVWFSSLQSPAQLLRCNPADLTDNSVLVFPADGNHGASGDLTFIPGKGTKGKVYVSFKLTATKNYVAEVDPDTLSTTDVIAETGLTNSGAEAITYDDNYLYTVSTPGRLRRYNIADFSFDSELNVGMTCHGMKLDGSDIFLTSSSAEVPFLAKRVDVSSFTVADTVSDGSFPANPGPTDDLAVSPSHIWVGLEGSVDGDIVRCLRSNLSSLLRIPTVTLNIWSVLWDGNYIWATYGTSPGSIVRLNISTLEKYYFHFDAGVDFDGFNEFALIGNKLYLSSFFAFPGIVVRVDLNQMYPAGEHIDRTAIDVPVAVSSAMEFSGVTQGPQGPQINFPQMF